MTDIFVRTRTRNPIRLALAEACLARLVLLDDAMVHVILAEGFALPVLPDGARTPLAAYRADPDRFHIDSRKVAHENATGDVYVVIDDDCLPIGNDWLRRGVETLHENRQFAALASWSINGEILSEKCALPPDLPHTYDPQQIFEVSSLGTPTFIWTDIDLAVPEGDLGQYDGTLSRAYLEHGRIGMLRGVRHNHLGYGLSEVVPEWWRV